jgi:nucleoside-diphosphate-sugar epimerase
MSMPVRIAARYIRNNHEELVTGLYRKSAFAKRLMKKAEQSLKTTPSNVELVQYSRKSHYAIGKARSLLGYEPQMEIRNGLGVSAAWLKHEYAVPD